MSSLHASSPSRDLVLLVESKATVSSGLGFISVSGYLTPPRSTPGRRLTPKKVKREEKSSGLGGSMGPGLALLPSPEQRGNLPSKTNIYSEGSRKVSVGRTHEVSETCMRGNHLYFQLNSTEI